MSKIVSFILVLVLFFGSAINCFAGDEEEVNLEALEIVAVVIIGAALVVYLVSWIIGDFIRTIAETPDNGIRMVSTEDEAQTVNTDGKTILNVLSHIEAGVTPNKDIYVGFRFQY